MVKVRRITSAKINSQIGITRQSVSIQEQEQRFIQRRALWCHDLVYEVLPEH